jgi:hypothetical protein
MQLIAMVGYCLAAGNSFTSRLFNILRAFECLICDSWLAAQDGKCDSDPSAEAHPNPDWVFKGVEHLKGIVCEGASAKRGCVKMSAQ